jgi:hypothetical protein
MLELQKVSSLVFASYVARLQELLARSYLAIGGRNGIFSGGAETDGRGGGE